MRKVKRLQLWWQLYRTTLPVRGFLLDSVYKCLLLLEFNETWIFSTDYRKILKCRSSRQIRTVEVELFHEDGRTDMKKLAVTFRIFANAPNINTKHKILYEPKCQVFKDRNKNYNNRDLTSYVSVTTSRIPFSYFRYYT